MDFPADGEQFLRDLAAGLAGPHNQDGPVGQLFRVAVAVRVQLQDVARQLCGQRGDFRFLVAAGGQHHVAGPPASLGGVHAEAAVCGRDAGDIRSCPDGRPDGLRIMPHVIHDVRARHKGLRNRSVIGTAGQREREVRRVQDERVPAVLPRTAQRGAPFQQLMFDAGLAQPVARGQAGLPGSDHKGVQNRSHAKTIRAAGKVSRGVRCPFDGAGWGA